MAKRNVQKRLQAKVGPEVCRDLMAYAERTGLSLENVAAVILAGPPRRKPEDKKREWTPEEIRKFCEQETNASGRGFELPALTRGEGESAPQLFRSFECLLSSKSFKNPSDDKHSIADQRTIADTRIARDALRIRPMFIRPKKQRHAYVFYYRIPPSGEILRCSWWSYRWKGVKEGFLRLMEGNPFELCRMERFPLMFTRSFSASSSETDKSLGRQGPFISSDRFKERYHCEELRRSIRDNARKLARRDTDLVSDFELEAWACVASVDSNDPQQWKIEAIKGMDAARRRKNFIALEVSGKTSAVVLSRDAFESDDPDDPSD